MTSSQKTTHTSKESLYDFVDACMYELEIDANKVNIDFEETVSFDGHLVGGSCTGDTEEVNIEIALNDKEGVVPQELLMSNLAHELIHAKQYLSGRLKSVPIFNPHDEQNFLTIETMFDNKPQNHLPYEEKEYEIEAYQQESIIVQLCTSKNRTTA